MNGSALHTEFNCISGQDPNMQVPACAAADKAICREQDHDAIRRQEST